MSKIQWKGSTLLGPIPPTMVTCGTMEHPNVLTVAWTGILNTIPPKTYISLRPERFSYDLVKESGEFVINLTTRQLVRAADFCGVRSGRELDKFALTGLHPAPAFQLSCPLLEESPVNLECKVTDIVHLGSHDMFLADIVAVDVEEELLDQNGKLCLDRCQLAAFAHGEYFALGNGWAPSASRFAKSPRERPAGQNAAKNNERRHINHDLCYCHYRALQ